MTNPIAAAAIYIMIWWISFFAVLPFGNISHREAGLENKDGGDPGAPLKTNLKNKILINTGIAFVLWAIFMLSLHFHWLVI